MHNSIDELQLKISDFCEKRDWNQFHTPKNLAISISIEAAELLENFQWSKENVSLNDQQLKQISEEVADVFIYSLRLCQILGIDLVDVSNEKIIKNEVKYPINLVKGKSDKYTNLK
tara:strand:- start:292 stop:639 length:348 start_codon:yes stop_codon:yes gene_type:complete